MDVTQRRLLNELNCSNKNTMNFFNNTLDPMIALPLTAVLDISFSCWLAHGQTKKFLLWKRVRNKTI